MLNAQQEKGGSRKGAHELVVNRDDDRRRYYDAQPGRRQKASLNSSTSWSIIILPHQEILFPLCTTLETMALNLTRHTYTHAVEIPLLPAFPCVSFPPILGSLLFLHHLSRSSKSITYLGISPKPANRTINSSSSSFFFSSLPRCLGKNAILKKLQRCDGLCGL